MKFLDQVTVRSELRDLINKSHNIRIAVAFWGQSAPRELGLLKSRKSIAIICNLKMGGTNPSVIRELIEAGIRVRQSDTLHAKVYLFDNAAIVGSSNASANGLSLQNGEAIGWHEANILVSNALILDDIRKWFDSLQSKAITPQDLDAATELWTRRRRAGIIREPRSKTLIDDLRSAPDRFENRRLYVCVYSEGLSHNGQRSLKLARKRLPQAESQNLDGFEWPELPDFADLICFWRDETGHVSHDGIWNMPEIREEITKFGTNLQICRKLKNFAGYPASRLGAAKKWAPALKSLLDTHNSTYAFADLGLFAKQFLQ